MAIARARTVAFEGVEARLIDVECAVVPGPSVFTIVGLPSKAVSEARDRLLAAFSAMHIALPAQKITVNLAPADLLKEGSHFDLPIALALLVAFGALPADTIESTVALGEMSLDGRLKAINGVLPAAMKAYQNDYELVCPQGNGNEAAWVDGLRILAPHSLTILIDHYKGRGVIPEQTLIPGTTKPTDATDLADVKGQERAKRALEVAAAGRHNMLMMGPPGAGKSMLAGCLPGILPLLSPLEALETSMIYSISGLLREQGVSRVSPFRSPHHTASTAAIVGGGKNAHPGEISLAHNGVLFMDEFPEYNRAVLETLRQPMEKGTVMIARANAHVCYPCRFLLIAAANPCYCGYMYDTKRACNRAPECGKAYLGRVSGPILDRFDLYVPVTTPTYDELTVTYNDRHSETVAARVQEARERQKQRFKDVEDVRVNADMQGKILQDIAVPARNSEGYTLLKKAIEAFALSARGYHRVLRVARTIADLDNSETINHDHIAEAISLRLPEANPL